MSKGAKGILGGLQELTKNNSEEVKNLISKEDKNLNSEEKIKRSYNLKASTIRKLNELKTFDYEVGIKLEQIVDEAICKLYEVKRNK